MRRTFFVTFAVLLTLGSTAAMAAWLATSSGANGFSKSASMPPGNAPAAAIAGSDVTVTWAQSTFGGSVAVNGYLVKRYDASNVVQTIGSQCSGTISTLSCTEQTVPAGAWKYTVTPVHGAWAGAESAYSNTVTVTEETESPSLTFPSLVTTLPSTQTASISSFTEGDELAFTVDGVPVTSDPAIVPAGGSGSFDVDLPLGLAQGTHSVTATADPSGDTASAAFTIDTVGPFVAVTFPLHNSTLSPGSYLGGCSTPAGDICGTASDATTGVASVQVAIKRADNLYFDGSGYTSSSPVFFTTTGTTTWSKLLGTPADGTYTITAQAQDGAGHSGVATSTFTIDSTAPNAPVLTSSTPSSPSNNASPLINGTAEAGAQIELYGNSSCSGTSIGSGNATGGTFAVNASVTTNATTTVYGLAKDGAGNASACSTTSVSYTHDGQAPTMPVITAVAPTSPSNSDLTPTVTGTRESGSIVKLYTNNSCTTLAGVTNTDSATGTTGFSISPTVAANSTTTFWAQANDSVGNTSACSTTSVTYTHDNVAPTPVITGTDPVSPSSTDNTPTFQGTGEPGASVQLRTACGTTSGASSSVTVAADGSWSITLAAVAANSNITRWAFSTDPAGNTACSTTSATYRWDTDPPDSSSVLIQPKAAPNVRGKPEAGDKIILTYDEAMKASSIMTGWNGSETDIRVLFDDDGLTGDAANDVITFNDTAATPTQLKLGKIEAKNNYASGGDVIFEAKMTLSADGTTVTVVLGSVSGTSTGTAAQDDTSQKLKWTPSTSATDLAGNACLATAREDGNDRDF